MIGTKIGPSAEGTALFPERLRPLYALGILLLLIAAGHALFKIVRGGPILEAVLDLVLIAAPGILVLYVRRWLLTTDFDPALYPRIALWCLGGVGVMLLFIVLRAVHPGVSVHWSFGTRAIALSMGSIAGLAIGIHEARALTREQELNQRNEELTRTKEQLAQRNEELLQTQTRLERSIQEVEDSNDRLEEFAYAVSHDLQEPLRMISTYVQLLDDRYSDDLDDEASEFIDFATDGAVRMQAMIQKLLQFSRVGTQDNQFEPVDLNSVIDDVRTDLQLRIDESNAEILADDLPRVNGDASQLRQLFQNLLSNAIEYSGDEPPRIHISAQKERAEQVISVADEGIGIDSEDQQRIFDTFQRLHTSDEHVGSGMGLTLCQRIVEHHGGEIRVDSEPGDGSTFSLTLPSAGEFLDRAETTTND